MMHRRRSAARAAVAEGHSQRETPRDPQRRDPTQRVAWSVTHARRTGCCVVQGSDCRRVTANA
eukprot:3442531-Pyramimonas_sp.AAC.2